ncbi:MAG: hypothetical protein LC754_13755 [Acidobacteria bacterium]|nr:hypothetical protein [Acidobacteriota bacterium]
MIDLNNFRLISNAEDVSAACEELSRHATLGFDTETTSLDPYEGRLRLLQFASPEGQYVFDLYRLAPGGDTLQAEALEPLRRLVAAKCPVKIAHNAKFDAKWVRRHLGVELGGDFDSRANANGVERVERGGIFDTMLASQIVSAGEQEDRHSLEAVAARYLNESLDKSQQVSDWSGELSTTQLEYAARDAAVMLPLRERLVELLRANNLTRCAQLEFECVVPIAALELNGIFLDKERWREQLAVVGKRRVTLAEELQEILAEESQQQSFFGPSRADINLDSHVQLTKALTRLGVPVPDSTRNWKLQPLANDYPVVATLLEYRTVQKALTSYGENILHEISPVTGRIHANFHQIGAPTGRMSCTSPNVQQVPHAVEYRRCFRAPEGRKLIIADYSQVELRILADFTNDKGFVDAFNSGADLHRVTAAQIFNVAVEEVTKVQRDFAKRLNFGVVYGIGAKRFAMMTGLSETEAEDLLRRYFSTYRDLDAWLRRAAQQAVRERTAPRTVAGRSMLSTTRSSSRQMRRRPRRLRRRLKRRCARRAANTSGKFPSRLKLRLRTSGSSSRREVVRRTGLSNTLDGKWRGYLRALAHIACIIPTYYSQGDGAASSAFSFSRVRSRAGMHTYSFQLFIKR